MSPKKKSNSNPNLIDEHQKFSANWTKLLKNSKFSDVTLVVKSNKFPVHRLILAVQSDFFQILLLENQFNERNSSEIALDADVKPFELLLEFIYSGKLDLRLTTLNVILALFELSHRYGVLALEAALEGLLITKLNPESFPTILGFANLFCLKALQTECMKYVDQSPLKVLCSYDSLGLDVKVLEEILLRDTLNITMIDKFKCVAKLVQNHSDITTEKQAKFLSIIDLRRLSNKEILQVVRPSKLYDEKFLIDCLASRDTDVPEEPTIEYDKGPEPLRKWVMPTLGSLMAGEPLAKVTVGKNPFAMFQQSGYCIGELVNKEFQIVVKLREKYIINSLAFNVGDSNYAFNVQLSSDRKKWHRVYQQGFECSTKRLRICFPEYITQYIKFTGTMEVSAFIADFATGTKFINGAFVPTFNVANEITAYCVPRNFNRILEGLRSSMSAMPYEAIANKRTIKICFVQPFWLKYCRLRLWDHDGRKYKFKVHVFGGDGGKGNCIFDGSNGKGINGWKQLTFTPQKVTRFEITTIGTVHQLKAIDNEFRLVFFEAE